MFKRIQESFDRGIEKIKWVASLLAERTQVELSVIKLMYRTAQLEKRREQLLALVGQRVLELKTSPDREILHDKTIADALIEIEHITAEIAATKKHASEISSIAE